MNVIKRILSLLNSDSLFFLAYALVLFSNVFAALNIGEEIFNLLDYIGIGICASIILLNFKKYTWKHWLSLAVCVTCAWFSGYKLWIKTAVLIMAAINLELSNIVKKDLFIRIFFVTLVILLSSFGLMDEAIRYRGESVRYSLGFGHPNALGFQMAMLAFDFVYLRYACYETIKRRTITLVVIGVAAFIYIVSESRTATVAMVLLTLYLLFETRINKLLQTKIVKRVAKFFFVFMFAISIGLALLRVDDASNQIAQTVDKATAGRVRFSAYYLRKYEVTPFGEFLPETSKTGSAENELRYQPLDNFYITYLYKSGVVFMTLYAVTMYVVISKLYKKESFALIAFLLILMIYALMENIVLRADMCALIFTIGIAGERGVRKKKHAKK